MRPDAPRWVIGIDAGGTFTDLVALDSETGELRVAKVSSTPASPVEAVLEALEKAAVGGAVRRLVHGTTVATNAILERRGARLCLLATEGFEDVVFIQRLNRPFAFDLHWRKPDPLVLRRHCLGVSERLGADGAVVTELGLDAADATVSRVRDLIEADAIDAVAISLLFSYLDPVHEELLAARLSEALPDLPVSVSSRISPVWREYERASTVLADAYVRPLMSDYLERLGSETRTRFGEFPLLVLKSNGGTSSPESVAEAPLTTLLSGLAGGAVGGAYFAAETGETSAITFDMGGTSTDLGLVYNGSVGQLDEYELEWGLPVVTPVVDVHPIGAGGGSIARIDRGGLLQVGPESAGASPGPACYPSGGIAPTVTDANLVLGRLDPDFFLGGKLRLDVGASVSALRSVAAALERDVEQAALAVVAVANENMANAIRLITIERGVDPQDFALVAFGGAGPLHACGVADALGMRRVVVPPHPGVCSAFGAAIGGVRVDRVWSVGVRADDADETLLRHQFLEAERSALAELVRDGVSTEVDVRRVFAARYYMQNYEEEIPVPNLDAGFVEQAVTAYHQQHRSTYGYAFDGDSVELVHCRLSATSGTERPRGVVLDREPRDSSSALRRVVMDDGSRAEVPVVNREHAAGRSGPLIVQERDSTIFVAAHWRVEDAPSECLRLVRGGV